jgi:hypothetical protein
LLIVVFFQRTPVIFLAAIPVNQKVNGYHYGQHILFVTFDDCSHPTNLCQLSEMNPIHPYFANKPVFPFFRKFKFYKPFTGKTNDLILQPYF